eukprot:15667-Heterococcus_DN1.PRE.6
MIGHCRLGDFGSTVKIGQEHCEYARTHISLELLSSSTASEQLDNFALAITLLELIGVWQLNAHGMPSSEAVTAAAMTVSNAEFKELVLGLLTIL